MAFTTYIGTLQRTGSQIDDGEKGGEPAEDAELDKVILNKRLGGATAQAENNHVLEIAQQTGEYPA